MLTSEDTERLAEGEVDMSGKLQMDKGKGTVAKRIRRG